MNFFIFTKFTLRLLPKRYFTYEKLVNKTLINVKGSDCRSFLQGLMSNDISCISNCYGCVYSLFLNAKGRILYDVILYDEIMNNQNEQSIFIECDTKIKESLVKHLKIYKLRKKVSISEIESSQISVILPSDSSEDINSLKLAENKDCSQLIYFGSDPRVISWCVRCVSLTSFEMDKVIPGLTKAKSNSYLESRLNQGICEGSDEIPLGQGLPMEYNGDIMNGISFNKGCYIGQELTARTYHTGVIRKRIVPLQIIVDQPIQNLSKSMDLYIDPEVKDDTPPIGQLKYINKNNQGLALVKLAFLTRNQPIKVYMKFNNQSNWTTGQILVPHWWPEDIKLASSV